MNGLRQWFHIFILASDTSWEKLQLLDESNSYFEDRSSSSTTTTYKDAAKNKVSVQQVPFMCLPAVVMTPFPKVHVNYYVKKS